MINLINCIRSEHIVAATFCLLSTLLGVSAQADLPEALADLCPQVELGEGGRAVNIAQRNKPLITVSSPEYANRLVSFLKNRSEIEHDYVIDGCDARAFLGAKALHEELRVFTTRVNVDNADPDLVFTTDKTFEGFVDFHNRHSTLMMCVKQESGEVIPAILEPTFSIKTMSYQEWILFLRDQEPGTQTVTTSSMFSLNPHATGRFDSFSSRDIQCAEEAMQLFTSELQSLRRQENRLPYAFGRYEEVLILRTCIEDE
ncbi:MAG: hypothetical protein HRT45_15955 [Bdellovibrionales bacterium]|nr:hypothetical protein [Bdellovibrionales bacterium]